MASDDKQVAQEFGQSVRGIREAKGLTQGALADLLGKSQQWLGKVEAGDLTVALKDSLAISEALGVPIRRLLPPEPAPRWFDFSERQLVEMEVQTLKTSIATLAPQAAQVNAQLNSERARLVELLKQLEKLDRKRSS